MQHFRCYLAGGTTVDAHLPQEAPITADDFYRYLLAERFRKRLDTEPVTIPSRIVVDDNLSFDARALVAVEKVQMP